MRQNFIKTLTELAEKDQRIILLTGDLGYCVLEPFIERFPDRFVNVGVAEQNMVGVATGLAEDGFIPFVYSIATFATLRPYEFIRNGPIQHNFPVRIVGVGGGYEYGNDGLTHYGLEDIGVLRIQPGIAVISPADFEQASSALKSTWDLQGPVYYRLGKDDTNKLSGLDGRFDVSSVQKIKEGNDLLFLTTGSISKEVVTAANLLEVKDLHCSVGVVPVLNPCPSDNLKKYLLDHQMVFTVEDHYVVGGLGSLVSEIVAEHNLDCKVIRCGIDDLPKGISGSKKYFYEKQKLSGETLADRVLQQFVNDTKTNGSVSKDAESSVYN